jgi:hypothetical protein
MRCDYGPQSGDDRYGALLQGAVENLERARIIRSAYAQQAENQSRKGPGIA